MDRDSLFNETILWSGRPRVVRAPFAARLLAVVSAVVSVVTLSFAVTAALTLRAHVGGMFLFAVWSGIPLASPWTARRLGSAVIALFVSITAVHVLVRAVPSIARVLRLHTLPAAMAGLLIFGVGLTVLLLASVAIGVAYAALLRP